MNEVFQLMISCCFPEILAIKSQSCSKIRQNFDVLGLFGRGVPEMSDRIW